MENYENDSMEYIDEEQTTDELESDLVKLVKHTIDYYELYVYPEIYDIVKMKVMFN
jgi:hypothetical protein